MNRLRRTLLGPAGFALLVLLAPYLLTNDYYLTTLTIAFLNAIIVVGLNLLLGYAGQISLGHGAFYGLGAYTTALATATWGLPIPVGMLAGVATASLVAWIVGIPALRLKGHYLAMATLGFGIIVYIFFNETISLTGGPSGFVGIPRLELFGYAFESDLSYYYLVGGALTLVLIVSLNLIDSRVGRALKAIHTSERAAQASGIDIARYKLLVFVLSAAFAGFSGVLYAHYLTFVAPSSFGFMFSVLLIVMVVLGGMSHLWGAVAGAVFLSVLPEFLRAFEEIEIVIYGLILVLSMVFLPEGIAGGVKKLAAAAARGRRHG
jgi:branched-chain amino acid transport system permease protein